VLSVLLAINAVPQPIGLGGSVRPHPGRPREQDTIMAKSQKRSTREDRKPKAAKVKPAVALAPNDNVQFKNAVRDPKAKH